jgi:serine/threonine-protein kinase haspin
VTGTVSYRCHYVSSLLIPLLGLIAVLRFHRFAVPAFYLMLGARTKQIFSYGKRSQRIINVDDDREEFLSAASLKAEETYSTFKSSRAAIQLGRENVPTKVTSPKAVRGMHKVPSPSSARASPVFAAKSKRLLSTITSEKNYTLEVYGDPCNRTRSPLAQYSTNAELPKSEVRCIALKKPCFADTPSSSTTTSPTGPKKFVAPPKTVGIPKTKRKPAKARACKAKSSPVAQAKLSSPTVDIDIVVVGDTGNRVSQEHRVVRPDVQVNACGTVKPVKRSLAGNGSAARPFVLSDHEDSPVIKKAKVPMRRARPIVLSSDESSGESDVEVLSKPPSAVHLVPPSFGQISSVSQLVRQSAVSNAEQGDVRLAAPPLTPVRETTVVALAKFAAATPSDIGELEEEFAELDLSPSVRRELAQQLAAEKAELLASQPQWLLPILNECGQTSPHDFSSFITTFPYDPIVYPDDESASRDPVRPTFKKIGEASYSEVFGIGDVVLKVIPLRDELATPNTQADHDVDTPAPSDAKDVLREIVVTRTIGDMCMSADQGGKAMSGGGFVKLLCAYVVRGRYPSLFLDLWDEFNRLRGSESVRPDGFHMTQTYAIIVLPNGGPDLETYTFERSVKSGWKQAASLFWQVARTLSQAEELVRFEVSQPQLPIVFPLLT